MARGRTQAQTTLPLLAERAPLADGCPHCRRAVRVRRTESFMWTPGAPVEETVRLYCSGGVHTGNGETFEAALASLREWTALETRPVLSEPPLSRGVYVGIFAVVGLSILVMVAGLFWLVGAIGALVRHAIGLLG